jgi:hypothetical protein
MMQVCSTWGSVFRRAAGIYHNVSYRTFDAGVIQRLYRSHSLTPPRASIIPKHRPARFLPRYYPSSCPVLPLETYHM